MRKIYTIILMVPLFAACLQTASASEGSKAPGKNRHAASPLACPIPGLYTIGPTGDYASITFAINELASCPSLTGAYIFELQSTYVSTVETFPIIIPNFIGSNASNTITFRPEAGATALSITSNNATGTILFDGGDYIAFDGRPGGAGTTKELTIQNTNVGNSYALRFVNDATNNLINYCIIRSANNSAAGATIILAGTTGTTGNDNITIDNNDIREVSLVATPNTAILSAGSTGSATLYNNNIIISNNNILNFYNSTGNIAGVLATQGSSNWLISGNNFNHTFGGIQKAISGSFSAINAVNTQMEDFTIVNNYIGGLVALPSGGNFNFIGTGTMHLLRLSLNVSVTNSIQGNTIWNTIFNSTMSSPIHSIINLVEGSYDFGTTAPNIIGSPSSTGNIAISLNNSTVGNNFAIICCKPVTNAGTVNISNNFIGNIDMAGTSSSCNFQLIHFEGNNGTYNILNNTLGSAVNNPSMNNYLNTVFTCINGNMATGSHTIINNTIINAWLPSTGAGGALYGIRVQGNASYNISGNTMSGFRSSTANPSNYSLIGINNIATTGGQIISGNKISLFSTAATSTRSGIAGIYCGATGSGANIVEKNFIHTFTSSSTVTSTTLTGIHAAAGSSIYKNNMIRMGITSAGGQISTGFDINGIYEDGGTNDFYFNSVYIGGSGVSAGSPSYAFNSTISGNVTRNYKNNIFYNARSSVSTTPLHYAIKAGGNAGVSSDYNVLLANGNGQMIANFSGTDIPTLALWRASIGGDINSYSADPQFLAPTGNSTAVDLHIKPSPTTTIVEANGQNIVSVTDDYDVQIRAAFSPTDIGADAGNFTAAPKADMGPISLLNPTTFACNTTGVQIKVAIKNFNSTPINFATSPVTVTVAVSGAVIGNFSAVLNTGTLAAGDSLIVTTGGTLNMSTAGTYNFSITTTTGGGYTDIDVTNNNISASVTPGTYNIGTLSSSVDNFCNSGIPVLTLTGTIGTVQWQQSTVSSTGPWTNVGTNSLTYIPATVTATTYYQAQVSCGASSGPSNVDSVLVIPASIANTGALADGVAVLSVCEGASITLTQTGGALVAGAQWQWYEGTPANNFINPIGSATTAADAATVITPTISATYYLRASGGTAPCDGNLPASNTGNPVATVIVNTVGTWLGGNSNWNDANNWCGGIPTAATDAFIPTGLAIYPIISTTQSVRNITIYAGASVTLSAAGELTIKGNYANTSGTIDNNGKIILNGTAVQTFPGATATVAAMNRLETDNAAGISIDNSFTISGKLQPTNGTVSLNNNYITIKSDATATANVGQMGSGAAFNYNGTGRFVVERFYPARRAWRLITAPVTGASGGTINSQWQEGATKWPMGPATPASNPNDGFGTHISGGANADGYDQNVNGNPSIKIFNAGLWTGMPIATSLYTKKVTDEPGYMLFVRGSRAVDLTFATATVPNNTVVRTTGQLKTANVAPVTVTGSGLTVLGNPFASAINFNTIASLNGFSLAENKYYMWDPSLTGGYGVGAWVTLAYNGSTYDRTVTTLNDYPSAGGNQGIDNIGTIQSGAAVMVDLGPVPQTININETVKVDGSSNLLFRPTTATRRKQMRTNLLVLSNGDTSLIDGTLVTYNPAYSNSADGLDVNKFGNFSENLGLSREGRLLAIERRSPIANTDTIFLNIAQMRRGTYMLSFEPDSLTQPNLACYLEDNYLNTKTPVALTEASALPFTLTDDASAQKDRFKLVFKPWIRFANCNATLRNDNIVVTWAVTGENDLAKYEIERSINGRDFDVIGSLRGIGNESNASYSFNDMNVSAGQYYYRIKGISKHGVVAYSNIAKAGSTKTCPSLYVFPNPVMNNNASLQISNKLPSGEYLLTLFTADRVVITTKKILHNGGRGNYAFMPERKLVPGIYQLETILPDKSRQTVKVIVK